jgi:hypothetical protein
LVPIVSQGVGYKDIVSQISPELVYTSIDNLQEIRDKLIKNKSLWLKYSKKAKKIASKYSYKYMINDFKSKLI